MVKTEIIFIAARWASIEVDWVLNENCLSSPFGMNITIESVNAMSKFLDIFQLHPLNSS